MDARAGSVLARGGSSTERDRLLERVRHGGRVAIEQAGGGGGGDAPCSWDGRMIGRSLFGALFGDRMIRLGVHAEPPNGASLRLGAA